MNYRIDIKCIFGHDLSEGGEGPRSRNPTAIKRPKDHSLLITLSIHFILSLLRLHSFIYFTHKINKHTDQLVSVNALGLAYKIMQFYAIKFVQKYY